MKRNATAAITLSGLMMLSGAALADHHAEDELAPQSGTGSANEVEDGTMDGQEGMVEGGAIVEEGGTDSANDPEADAAMSDGEVGGGEVSPDSGLDSANDPED